MRAGLGKGLLLALLVLAGGAGTAPAAGGGRENLNLPDAVRGQFLADMRAHLGNLDDIVAAVAAGDFRRAAKVAAFHMDFGHKTWESLLARGMSEEDVLTVRRRFMEKAIARDPDLNVTDPGDVDAAKRFRVLAIRFHAAAGRFAEAAWFAYDPPSLDDHRRVLERLQEITAVCRECHATFRVRDD
ncbi:MAG: hypothetical protein H6907_17220 [Hyphomicrobiales bacterium]|nr:hypothetical protein [Hyphomicrobiales bacterium]